MSSLAAASSSDDLAFASAAELADLVRQRQLSPVELTRMTLDRIEQSQSVLNAFITVSGEQALEQAKAAEEAVIRGEPLGPLHGVPFSVKDVIPTAGVRTTFGSLIFKDHVPTRDAVAVARVKEAGGILIGKTTTPEFAFLGFTEAPLFGRTCNAWSRDRTCGGSSGGAAAAVASGLGPIAVATDAGGSARIPAACNGVVGFKQSLGVVPHDWADDGFSNTQYVSPIARTVRDTAILLEVMAGPHPSDPWSLGRGAVSFEEHTRGSPDLKAFRITWRPLMGNTRIAADVRSACEAALQTFVSLGCDVTEDASTLDNPENLISVVNASYRRAQYGRHLGEHRAIMSPSLLRQFDRVTEISAEELWQGMIARTRLFRDVQSWFQSTDLVVTPTLSRDALPLDQDFFGPIEIDGAATDTPRRAWYPYTIPFNATGNPAISIPCGTSSDELPIGLQIIGPVGADSLVLRAASAFEEASPWRHRRPSLN